jgi:hypothetical protein
VSLVPHSSEPQAETAVEKAVICAEERIDREAHRRRAQAAIDDMKRIAREHAENPDSANEPSSLELLRELRSSGTGGDPGD